ncbi:MAG TPA: hypothetical protein ACHBW8_15040, partial [Arsenophonus nasoniae]
MKRRVLICRTTARKERSIFPMYEYSYTYVHICMDVYRVREKPRYDGCCRDHAHNHTPNEPHVVRFRNPQE